MPVIRLSLQVQNLGFSACTGDEILSIWSPNREAEFSRCGTNYMVVPDRGHSRFGAYRVVCRTNRENSSLFVPNEQHPRWGISGPSLFGPSLKFPKQYSTVILFSPIRVLANIVVTSIPSYDVQPSHIQHDPTWRQNITIVYLFTMKVRDRYKQGSNRWNRNFDRNTVETINHALSRKRYF